MTNTNIFAETFAPHFESWYLPLYPLLNTLYFENLIYKVNDYYQKSETFPAKGNTLKAFRLTKWNDLRVVILGQDPYPNERATGLAFANPISVNSPSPALRNIVKRVEKDCYNGLKLDFDYSLESWAKQGVFLFNTALTVSRVSGSHVEDWKLFTEEILNTINNKKEGIIFMLWGKYAQSYSHLIDKEKHHILEWEHPTAASYQGREWLCPHFLDSNEILKNNPIKW